MGEDGSQNVTCGLNGILQKYGVVVVVVVVV